MIFCISLLIFSGLIFLQKRSFVGIVLGMVLVSNGINLSIFYGSKPDLGLFAFADSAGLISQSNDPLPQALVLTAIVIGFALLGYLVALVKKLSLVVGGFDTKAMREEDCVE